VNDAKQAKALVTVLANIQTEAEALMVDSCKRFVKTPIVKVILSKKSLPMNKTSSTAAAM